MNMKQIVAEYEKIVDAAWNEYRRAMASAWTEYSKARSDAFTRYQKVQDVTFAGYEKIVDAAYVNYGKVEKSLWVEFDKIQTAAWKKIAESADCPLVSWIIKNCIGWENEALAVLTALPASLVGLDTLAHGENWHQCETWKDFRTQAIADNVLEEAFKMEDN